MNELIVNTYDQLKAAVRRKLITEQQAISLSFSTGEGAVGRGWRAYSPFFDTDPDADAWYARKRKLFHDMDKKKAEADGLAWVREQTGIEEWKRNASRDWVPVIVAKNVPFSSAKERAEIAAARAAEAKR